MATETCLVGQLMNTQCGANPFFKESIDLTKLSVNELKTLKYRIPDFPEDPVGVICPSHQNSILTNYSVYQIKCSDPYERHGVTKSSLKMVSLEICERFFAASHILIPPGNKLCISCYKTVTDSIKKWQEAQEKPVGTGDTVPDSKVEKDSQESGTLSYSQADQSKISSSEQSTNSLGFLPESQEQIMIEERLKKILNSLGLDMPPRKKLSIDRFEKKVKEMARNVYERTIDCANLTVKTNVNINNIRELERDRKSLHAVLENIRSCYEKQTTYSGKIRPLTLFPTNWSYNDIRKYVDCSSYMVRKATLTREAIGVMENPPRKSLCQYSDDLIEEIEGFYKIKSRICAGVKECVSVMNKKTKIKEKLQKKLILGTVRELYEEWVKINMDSPEKVPGFSYFANMRPKDCKLPGEPGTHTICVCGEHQNVKLKCRACSPFLDYKKLLNLCVCSVENETFMLQDCPNCPGPEAISAFLKTENLMKNNGTIKYYNWLSVDIESKNDENTQTSSRVTLKEVIEDVTTFYEQFIEDIWHLRKHHFISESQKNYLEYMKSNLQYDIGLLMLDFAENYSFIAQDSSRAFYYNSLQATLHPFVLYYRNSNDKLEHTSFCIVSDYLKHNAYVVNIFEEKVLEEVKQRFPWIKKLIYFSDGAPTQYKNKNNFVNICAHEKDFGVKVESYNFLATSHGKGPCDGIGAVAKRMVREASLTLPSDRQISIPLSMFQFLDEKMTPTS